MLQPITHTFALFRRIEAALDFLEANNLYPNVPIIEGCASVPMVAIKGMHGLFLTFSSNNYLSLASHPDIIREVKKYLGSHGIGTCATPILGTLSVHQKLERTLADFAGFEDVITFSSASLASVGCIKALVDPFPYYRQPKQFDGLIIGDALNHASLVDAAKLAKSDYIIYKHNDMADLERLLKKYSGLKGLLIVTDGVFSMDGTLADLRALRGLADAYNTMLMVDDSHGFGVLAPNGEGTARHLNIQPDILLSSFTKGSGSIGGFVAANTRIVKYLRIVARTAIFSDPIPPALAAGLIRMVEVLQSSEGKKLRQTMHSNAEYLRNNLKRLGFDILGEYTPIVPLIIGNEPLTMEFSRLLFEMNIIAPAIRYPAVPHGKERLRFSITAGHKKEHLDHLIESCQTIGKRLSLI